MPETVSNVMSTDLATIESSATVSDAAHLMDERDVGNVLVADGGRLCGIVTDRDIAIRAVGHGADPRNTPVGEICSKQLASLRPDQSVDDAIALMREKAVRRLPVIDDDTPVGIVSLGDLAIERDRKSVLGDISAAPSNN